MILDNMDRGTQAVLIAIIFSSVAILFISLRCVARFIILRQAGIDDFLILFAMVLSVLLTLLIAIQKEYGLGKHVRDVSDAEDEMLLKLLYSSIIIYNLGLLVVKDSILYQYLRFFLPGTYRIISWVLMAFIMVAGTTLILLSAFSCSPVEFYWDKTLGGRCIDIQPLCFMFAALNITTDLAVYVLPMPVLRTLHLPRRQKFSLILVFALGGFGCVTSILRLHALYVASVSTDITYDNVEAAIWSCAELNVGIMCACIPPLRPLITAAFPRLLNGSPRRISLKISHHPSYSRNDSIIELFLERHAHNHAAFDSSLSLNNPPIHHGAIKVKQEWSVSPHYI